MSPELNEHEKVGLDEELEKLHALIHFKITEQYGNSVREYAVLLDKLRSETITATRWQCDSAGPLRLSYHFPLYC